MEQFANLPEDDRETFFNESAVRRNLRTIIIEKDFWVCWALGRIYAIPEFAPHVIFKGGTSLSKAFGLIDRFSEDVDLTIGRTAPFIKDTASPVETGISGKERERRINELKSSAQRFVLELALPGLQECFSSSLTTVNDWSVELDKDDPDGQTLLFRYPKRSRSREIGYIHPFVRLEFGARGETEPHEVKRLRPYVFEDFPNLSTQSTVQVATLSAERTFWEKATILHALHHGSKLRSRMSRHYYDTFMIEQKGIADKAIQMPELLEQVVRNKSVMFRDSKASYNTATIKNLRLAPTDEMLVDLRRDYAAMQEMFMSEPPTFELIMEGLKALEQRINQTKLSRA